jgi:hypothetical protein
MKWVIEQNSFNEDEYHAFVNAVKSLGLDYEIVKVVPFSHDIVPEIKINDNDKVIVFGSILLCSEAKKKGWVVYHNDNFDQRIWTEKYKEWILNDDAEFYVFNDVPTFSGIKFIRPVKDWKMFAGKQLIGRKLNGWRSNLISHGYKDGVFDDIGNEWVSLSSIKNIKHELRFCIVGGKVVTGSYYRINKKNKYVRYESSGELFEWVQNVVDTWKPIDTFAIDVAITSDDEKKIIEIGTLNGCGLYALDSKKIVEAICENESEQRMVLRNDK